MIQNKTLFCNIFNESHISAPIVRSNYGSDRNLISRLSLLFQDFAVKRERFYG